MNRELLSAAAPSVTLPGPFAAEDTCISITPWSCGSCGTHSAWRCVHCREAEEAKARATDGAGSMYLTVKELQKQEEQRRAGRGAFLICSITLALASREWQRVAAVSQNERQRGSLHTRGSTAALQCAATGRLPPLGPKWRCQTMMLTMTQQLRQQLSAQPGPQRGQQQRL